MIRLSLSILAGCLPFHVASAQQTAQGGPLASLKHGVWVTYGAFDYAMVATPPHGHGVADGLERVFAIRMVSSPRNGRWRGQLRWPGDVAARYSRPPAAEWALARGDFNRSPDEAVRLWQTLLDHHWPATPFVLNEGKAKAIPTAAMERHRRCASRLVSAAFDREIAASKPEASTALRRRQQAYEARLGPDLEVVNPLLAMLTAGLTLAGADQAAKVSQSVETRYGKNPEVAANGRVYRVSFDFLANPKSSAPAQCRMMVEAGRGKIIRDECVIEAVVDRRDGWPFYIHLERTVKHSSGHGLTYNYGLQRLAPARIEVPPNPCA